MSIWVEFVYRTSESAAGTGEVMDGSGDPVCRLCVSIEDHGAGFDLPAVRLSGDGGGLAGMQERVALLGGQLTIDARPGTGADLTAVLPI